MSWNSWEDSMKVSYYYFLDIIGCFVIENELLNACRVFIDVFSWKQVEKWVLGVPKLEP